MQATFFVPGTPIAQGSKNAFVSPKTLKAHVVETSHAKLQDWRFLIEAYAGKHRPDKPSKKAIVLTARFLIIRPKGHYGTGRNAKELNRLASRFPTGNRDLDKLARAIGDALTGIFYADDSQVVDLFTIKRWCDRFDEKEGCWITVREKKRFSFKDK